MLSPSRSTMVASQVMADLNELWGTDAEFKRLADAEPTFDAVRSFLMRRLRGDTPDAQSVVRLVELLSRLDAARRLDLETHIRSHAEQITALRTVVQEIETASDMPQVVTRALCTRLGYGKTMFSLINGSSWSPVALHVNPAITGDYEELLRAVDGRPISLREAPREAELVRRRRPFAVEPREIHRHTYKRLVDLSLPAGYAAVPVVVGDKAIAVIHVDRQDCPLSDTDIHVVGVLATACALTSQRAELRARIRDRSERTRQDLERLTQSMYDLAHARLTLADAAEFGRRSIGHPVSGMTGGGPAVAASSLTARERQVLELVAVGATNAAISHRLHISDATVKSHVNSIFRKLGVSTRAEVAALCAQNSAVGNP